MNLYRTLLRLAIFIFLGVVGEGRTMSAPSKIDGKQLFEFFEDTLNSKVSIKGLAKKYGSYKKSKDHNRVYDLLTSLGDVERVVVRYARNQNREFLDHFEILFQSESRPTVNDFAYWLGLQESLSDAKIRNTCIDGYCPCVILPFTKPGRKESPLRVLVSIDEKQALATSSEESPDWTILQADSFSYFAYEWDCQEGVAISDAVTFSQPQTREQKFLAKRILKIAKQLAQESYDKEVIAKALGGKMGPYNAGSGYHPVVLDAKSPVVRLFSSYGPRIRENDISHYSWVELYLNTKDLAPFQWKGFEYVDDPETICKISHSGKHLWRFPQKGKKTKFDVYLIVTVKRHYRTQVPYINYIKLERSPSSREKLVF